MEDINKEIPFKALRQDESSQDWLRKRKSKGQIESPTYGVWDIGNKKLKCLTFKKEDDLANKT